MTRPVVNASFELETLTTERYSNNSALENSRCVESIQWSAKGLTKEEKTQQNQQTNKNTLHK